MPRLESQHGVTPPHRQLCRITPQLYLCSELPSGWEDTHATLEQWAAAGISDILDVRCEGDDRALVGRFRPEIGYHHHPTDDDGRERPDRWFDGGTATLTTILTDPNRRAVVHCAMGVNRGPSMAFAQLLRVGWSPAVALDTIRAARPVAVTLYAEDAVRWAHRARLIRTRFLGDDIAAVHQWFTRNIDGADWIIDRFPPSEREAAR